MSDLITQPVIDKDSEAVALATVIFAAGFFLGIGTGMLLGASAGSGARERVKKVVDHLMGDATKGLGQAMETGRQILNKENRSDPA